MNSTAPDAQTVGAFVREVKRLVALIEYGGREAGCNLDTVRLAGNDLGVATGTLARLRVATNDLAIRVLRSRDADGG